MGGLRDAATWLRRLTSFCARVLRAFSRNRGILLAGGVGYNALLSLVPFLTLLVAALSIFFDEARIRETLRSELTALVPQHADTVVQTAQTFLQNQASIRAVSVAMLLFFSSVAFRMLEEAVAAIFHTSGRDAHRSFWISALLPYLFMLLLMVSLLGITLLTATLDALDARPLGAFGLERPVAYGLKLLLRLSGFLGLVLLFTGIYRVLPVIRISTRRAFVGGLAAAVLWRLTARFTVYFFANLSMVNVLYGSLATVVVVLLSLEIVFVILLLGAQVIAELEASAAAGARWYEEGSAPAGVSPGAARGEPGSRRSGSSRPASQEPAPAPGAPRWVAGRTGESHLRDVFALFLVALLLLGAWFIAVVAFQVTAAAIHLLLVLAVVLFAAGFLRRRFERPRRLEPPERRTV